jgi:uncharacterized FlaG/YvyC family protein
LPAGIGPPRSWRCESVHTATTATEQTNLSDAYTRLAEQLTREQKELVLQIDADVNAYWVAEQQAITDELKRHIPVFAAMIQLAHEHIMDQRPALRGVCCTPGDTSPRYV